MNKLHDIALDFSFSLKFDVEVDQHVQVGLYIKKAKVESFNLWLKKINFISLQLQFFKLNSFYVVSCFENLLTEFMHLVSHCRGTFKLHEIPISDGHNLLSSLCQILIFYRLLQIFNVFLIDFKLFSKYNFSRSINLVFSLEGSLVFKMAVKKFELCLIEFEII